MKVRLTEKGMKVANECEIPEEVRERFESIFKEGNLVLFMTYGMSLKKWKEAGILERELKPYRELKKHLNSISIVTYGDGFEPYIDGINVLYNNTALPDFLYSIFAPWIHRRILREADYFKTNQIPGSWSAAIAKKLFGKRLLIRQGYPWFQTLQEKKAPFWKRILAGITERIAYNAADGIIVTTERDNLQIQKNYSVSGQKIHIVPNYIDTDLFKPDPSLRVINRLLYVGRLEPEKNLINLIRAVKGLEVELILIGEGSLRPRLETLVKVEGIRNVKFLGRVPNESLPQEYNKAEIFILPSLYEGMPKVLIEAMACGCLVIGSNVRGIKELIVHEKTGLLCGTAEATIRGTILYAIMFSIGSNNVAEQIRKQARETIVNNYSFEDVIKKELILYRLGQGVFRKTEMP